MRKQLCVVVTIALVLSFAFKATGSMGLRNPSTPQLLETVAAFLKQRGFDEAGQTMFAGRPAVLLGKGQCHIYVVAVALQSWQEAAIRNASDASQTFWYVFDGELYRDRILHTKPMAVYYFRKSLASVGIRSAFPTNFVIVSSGECEIPTIDWINMPRIDFAR